MTIIDETTNGVAKTGVSRRHFIQGAAAVAAGTALPVAGALGAGVASAATAKTLRIATQEQEAPAAPWETRGGSLGIIAAVGEWLIWINAKGELIPAIATKWKGTNGGQTWTFTIRTDVKFHDGTPLTADDVVYTFKSHIDPKNKSRSAAILANCTAEGIVKVNATTIRFDLKSPDANFPYQVGSTSYGLCILKNNADGGVAWTEKMIGAGPWIMTKHTINDRTVFKANKDYYDKARIPKWETLEQIQYVSAATAIPALLTGKLDAIGLLLAQDAAKLPKAKFDTLKVPTCGGLHMHMRCDFGPFMDKRVRKAAALTLDRAGFIKGVLGGAGEVANDSVMDSFKSTVDTSEKQRTQDIAAAKKLMAEAGVPNGFKVDLSTWKRDDNDKFAQYVKTAFKEIGIDVTLYVDGSDGGASVFYTYVPATAKKGVIPANNGSWLACNLGIAEWGGRPTPDQYLAREWHSDGDWNAAHVNSPTLDAAIKEWQGALTLPKKKAASSKIQNASLEETPYIIAYNEVRVSAVSKKVKGIEFNGMGQGDLRNARPA
jgi:peptide/nickel transport system substrate-binding protein